MKQLKCHDYDIIFGSSQKCLSTFLESTTYSKIFILVDENTAAHCLPDIAYTIKNYQHHVIEIMAGEDHKNLETCQYIYSELLNEGADRHSLLINLGGGVIGDMGGFCASTFMRGIDFIQIPTTLLSQVDSSVGGKLGVDFNMVKNIVGVFNNPALVIIDKQLLKTLDGLQVRSGYAEVVKHGLIAEKNLYQELAAGNFGLDPHNLTEELLYTSINVKRKVVEEDPFEKGLRKILNYGHTVGHAVETESWNTDNPLLHGEAIFIGMICENHMASAKSLLDSKIMHEVNEQLKSIFHRPEAIQNTEEILKHKRKDKKNQNNNMYAALLNNVGSAIPATEISEEEVLDSLSYYKNL